MDTKDMKENVKEDAQELRRPPRKEVTEILVIHDPEEPLKSERVEEALQAMPDWTVTDEGESITGVKELPTSTVAALYTAYVAGLAGARGLPVHMSITDGLVMVTLHGPYKGGLTESVLDVACQIG